MNKLFFIFILFAVYCSCKSRPNPALVKSVSNPEEIYNFQANIRFSNKYFNIFLNRKGEGFVIKGLGSSYTEPFKANDSSRSEAFKVDSVALFFHIVNQIKDKPRIDSERTDAPRVEIYYEQKKIYDAYKWNDILWDLFRLIMEKLPKGFNPFIVTDKSFG